MIPEPSVIEWLFETYRWLLQSFGGIQELSKTKLVLPTPTFFPVSAEASHENAEQVFDIVKQYARMQNFSCRLELYGDPEHQKLLKNLPEFQMKSEGAGGLFVVEPGQDVVIRYNEESLTDPVALVATFAHELSHYLMATARTDPPGDKQAHEPATDVCAVFLGFGVFLANSAFKYEGFTEGMRIGWRSSRLGYLDEREIAYALAVFMTLCDISYRYVRKYLKLNPKVYLKKAMRDIKKNRQDWIEELKRIV